MTSQRTALCPVSMGDLVLVPEDMYGMPLCTSLSQLTYSLVVDTLFRYYCATWPRPGDLGRALEFECSAVLSGGDGGAAGGNHGAAETAAVLYFGARRIESSWCQAFSL